LAFLEILSFEVRGIEEKIDWFLNNTLDSEWNSSGDSILNVSDQNLIKQDIIILKLEIK